jgi:nicotinate phosphoribosyltransferase
MLSFTISGNYTDLYQLNMSEVNFLEGRVGHRVCFDYFFRSIPNNGGYVLFAGLGDVLNVLEDLHFTQSDLKQLRSLGFERTFVDYLEKFQFRGDVYSAREGEVIFPQIPALRVEGNIVEAQLVETLLLNILNFQSLIATKASRMRRVAGERILSEFGLRRAQGPAGIMATRAATIGGFTSTSNVMAGGLYNIEVSGTMAHAFIESYESELEAFRAFGRSHPRGCIFLVDTYDTLHSGVPNAIIVAREMEAAGYKAAGIRLDSGDLAWLSKEARKMLDAAGLQYMKIVASNQLDEFIIKSLQEQGAAIDVYGVGTKLVTGYPDAALDGVYKLCMINEEPKIKMSENIQKATLPGIKQVYRTFDKNNMFAGADAIMLHDEDEPNTMFHPFDLSKHMDLTMFSKEPLLQKVMDKGRISANMPSLAKISAYAASRISQLPAEYKRFDNPHVYKVGLSRQLLDLRNELANQHKTQGHLI